MEGLLCRGSELGVAGEGEVVAEQIVRQMKLGTELREQRARRLAVTRVQP